MKIKSMRRAICAMLLTGAALSALPVSGVAGANQAAGAQVPVLVRPSDAQGNGVNGPGYFVQTVWPGTAAKLYAMIGNRGTVPARISLVPVDATSGVFGGISYNLPQQPRVAVGSWIHLSRSQVRLSGGKGTIVPFTVHVPVDAQPGQYIGGLTAYVPAPKPKGHGAVIQVQTRAVTAIVINVSGPKVTKFQIKGVNAAKRPDSFYVLVSIANSGNQLLSGKGWLWVTKPGTKGPIISKKLFVDTTVPHTSVSYPVPWTHHPSPGRYRAHVVLSWSGGKASVYTWFTATSTSS